MLLTNACPYMHVCIVIRVCLCLAQGLVLGTMSRAAKRARRARTDELSWLKSRLPFITQSALSAFLTIAKTEKLPDFATRNSVRAARDTFVQRATPYGQLHTRLQVTDRVSIEIQNPFAMLHRICKHSASFSSLMSRTLAENPVSLLSQWHAVLYTDEVSPGNQLAYSHRRKTWAIYWSFVELGEALSQEEPPAPTHAHTCTVPPFLYTSH